MLRYTVFKPALIQGIKIIDSIFMSHHIVTVFKRLTGYTEYTFKLSACLLLRKICCKCSKLYRKIIAGKKEIMLSSSNFRYFRHAKNQISIILKYINIYQKYRYITTAYCIHYLCVSKIMSPQWSDLILSTNIPDSKTNILIFHSFYIKSYKKKIYQR